MAETNLTKLKTGSTGPQGEPIFDVFAGEEHIKDPGDKRLAGVRIQDLPDRPTAPTGFKSEFKPISLNVTDNIPASALEDRTTEIDIKKLLKENTAKRDKAMGDLIDLQTPTEKEVQLTSDIEELQSMIREGVQKVEERGLEGGVLRSGIASEINNIVQGNTRESLAILRNIDTKTRLLTAEQRTRQSKIEVEKLKMERVGMSEDGMFKIYGLMREMEKDQTVREDRLNSNQDNFLKRMTERYVGLAFSELDPQIQRDIAGEANRLDPSGALLAGIRNRLNIEKQQLELDQISKDIDGGGDSISNTTKAIIENPSLFDDLTSTKRGIVISELQANGYDTSNLGLKGLSDTAIKEISQTEKAVSDLGELRTIINNNQNFIGPISGLQKYNPWSKAREVQATIDRVKQTVGKALEGGVLRKEDEEKYKKILATITDTPSTALFKVDSITSSIQRDIENYKQLQLSGGRSLNINAPLNKNRGNEAIDIDKLRSKYNY